jgi:hypothetical protein
MLLALLCLAEAISVAENTKAAQISNQITQLVNLVKNSLSKNTQTIAQERDDFSSFIDVTGDDDIIKKIDFGLAIVSHSWFAVLVLSTVAFILTIIVGIWKRSQLTFKGDKAARWVLLAALLSLTLFVAAFAMQSIISLTALKGMVQLVIVFVRFLLGYTNWQDISSPQNICVHGWYTNNSNQTLRVFPEFEEGSDSLTLHYQAQGPTESWSPVAVWNARRKPGERKIPNPSTCCFDTEKCSGTLPSTDTCPGFWMSREGSRGVCACNAVMIRLGLDPEPAMTVGCVLEIRDRLIHAFD